MSEAKEDSATAKTRRPTTAHKHGGLAELPATAICGNDITSSCLYVSALSILWAGQWAWLALLTVAAVLFLYRAIYAEVVGALPLNGGAYNALLNTTSKRIASLAAVLTILSYLATAVISGLEAMHYVERLFHGLNVEIATVVLLAVFMVLTIVGIQESSRVAVAIFLFHLSSLTLLVLVGIAYLLFSGGLETFLTNWQTPLEALPKRPAGMAQALFFGFAAAMLGISGFESSSNFVEEQAEGVFPKTLRNMWIAVSIFNPAMALLALAVVPIAIVPEQQNALLAYMGEIVGGRWLSVLISVDAALVLSGAVLTAFIGVTGLVRRMTLDRVLPQLLLKTNRRGTAHRIIISFFLLGALLVWVTRGELGRLAGVYTISFLSVMALFGIGNVLLKVKRARLPRPSRASWPTLIVGIVAVSVGLAGNLIMDPMYFRVFLYYFVPSVLVATIMLGRIGILKACLFFVRRISESISGMTNAIATAIHSKMDEINAQQVVFFTRGDSIHNLNEAMLYVRTNEHTNRIKVVTVVQDEKDVPARLKKDLAFLDEAYPEIDIDFVVQKGEFGPKLIQKLSKDWKIPTNFMFIASPGDHFMYGLAELGGVRLII